MKFIPPRCMNVKCQCAMVVIHSAYECAKKSAFLVGRDMMLHFVHCN